MISLEFFTDDVGLRALAEAYWALNDEQQWKFKVVEIEKTFGVKQGQTKRRVADICKAIATTHRCDTCPSQFEVIARSDFDYAQKNADLRARGFKTDRLICSNCEAIQLQMERIAVAEEMRRQREAAEAAAKAAASEVERWLGSLHDTPHVRSYKSISLRDAFLLDGLLRYAGDAWRDNTLDAWIFNQPKLCDLEVDTRSVFLELYQGGWLLPSPDSPLDAFTLDADGSMAIDVLRVIWIIAADDQGESYSSLLGFVEAVQRSATAEDLHAIWLWVGLCEMRQQFAFCHGEFNFRSRGWSAAVHKSVISLLDECSVGVVKTVMYKSFTYLASELQKRRRPAAHTYSMLPGNMLQAVDLWRSEGWQFKSWRPLSHSVYSRHLFNRVMGGGAECYDKVTGASLRYPGESSLFQLT